LKLFTEMYTKVLQELTSQTNQAKIEVFKRFFKTGKGQYGEGDQFLGITVPILRNIAKKNQDITITDVEKLLKHKVHEVRLCALLILVYKFKKADGNVKKQIFDLYLKNTQYINNWDLVDLTAPTIVGEYLIDKDRTILYELAKNSDLWKRRIAIIATFAFIREQDVLDTIKISKILINDKHDLIHKATGWMLREVFKRNNEMIIDFLNDYATKMPRTMLRYTIEKMPQEQRLYYLHLR